MTIQRYLVGFLSFLFAASVAAFLLYVPMLPAIAVAMILMGLGVMFALGYLARQPLSYRARRKFGHKPSIVQSLTEFITGPDRQREELAGK